MRASSLSTALLGVILCVGLPLSGCGGGGSDPGPAPGPDPGHGNTDAPVPPEKPAVTELRSDKTRDPAPGVSSGDAAVFAHDNLAFSVDLYLELRANASGNFLFSQTSISTALAMLYAGARTETAEQMAGALHFTLPAERLHAAFNAQDLALTTPPPNAKGDAFRIEIANSFWLQDGLHVLPGYLDTLAENYGAGVIVQDFAKAPEPARTAINDWVAYQTENEIRGLFPQGSIGTLTRLVLANAVFFHGDWRVPFEKDSPNQVFHALAGDVNVPTMHGHSNARLWNGRGWSAASLGYVGDTTSMILVVPDAGTFASFEAEMTAESLSNILAGADAQGGDLVMPRFRFASDFPLNDALSALGMSDAFGEAADFSGIDGARDLSVQAVIHKAMIDVDESGTTAAAATGGSVGVTSAPPTLYVDRPFLFFIRHDPSGAILFMGRVVDPTK